MGSFVGVGGKIDELGYSRLLDELFSAGVSTRVATGLQVTQRGAGADDSVDIQPGVIGIEDSSTYVYSGWLDAVKNTAATATDPTNPRHDIVVAYIDFTLVLTSATNNPGALKFKVVPGTAAGSPVDPSDSAIQTSVGSSNIWQKLARLRRPANSDPITTAMIDDLRVPIGSRAPHAWQIAAVSSSLTVGSQEIMNVDTSGGDVTITLPDATLNTGRNITLMKKGAGNHVRTLPLAGGQTIDGGVSDILYGDRELVTYCSDGTNWFTQYRKGSVSGIARAAATVGLPSGSYVQFINTGAIEAPAFAKEIEIEYGTGFGGATTAGTGYLLIDESDNGAALVNMDSVFGTSGLSAWMPGAFNQPTAGGKFRRSVTPGHTYAYVERVNSSGGNGNALKGLASFIGWRFV